MCPTRSFLPHRERVPVRRCTDCSALLSSPNETATCFACDPSWSPEPDFNALGSVLRESIGDAIDRILVGT